MVQYDGFTTHVERMQTADAETEEVDGAEDGHAATTSDPTASVGDSNDRSTDNE
jgi:hypothetical protein